MIKKFDNDDIELAELIKALWQERWIVIGSTILGVIVAVVYVLMAQQLWIAKATISPSYQMQGVKHVPLLKKYFLEDDNVARHLFDIYITEFNTRQNKKQFLECSDELDKIKNRITLEEYECLEQYIYQNFDSSISVSPVKGSGNVEYTLQLQSTDKDSAFLLLQSYIEFVNKLSQQKLKQELMKPITLKLDQLSYQKQVMEAVARLTLQKEIELTEYALGVADKVGLKQPSLASDSLFAINMGSNVLEEKLNVLKKIKDLSLVEPRLLVLDAELEVVANAQRELDFQILPYCYLKEPSRPRYGVMPKRASLIAFGLLLGGMFGVVVVVLVRFVLGEKAL